MSFTGRPTDCRTITIVTKPADGILAAPIEATVAVKLLKYAKIFLFKIQYRIYDGFTI